MGFSMLAGSGQNWIDLITGIFALIPQFLYFIYACCACLLDFLQALVRKLVGLDVYYVDGVKKSGDFLSEFISGVLGINKSSDYSALSTVFWSMVIFGVALIVITTIIAILKGHFNYDAKKSNPVTVIFASIKSLFMVAIVPILCVFGIYISNVLLKVLDEITSPGSNAVVASTYENSNGDFNSVFKAGENSTGEQVYASYDMFGFGGYSDSLSFSGVLFKISARDCNRVRYGSYTASKAGEAWSDFGIFNSKAANEGQKKEEICDMIDTAFANNLTLQYPDKASLAKEESAYLISSFSYLESAVWYLGIISVDNFSKFNVGLVWYYYNLWAFNFFIALVGVTACLTLLTNISFGLITRFLECFALFIIYPGFVGMSPLDNGGAMKKWNGKFIANVLMGLGAIVGLNLAFLVLPYFQQIRFFGVWILDGIMDIILIVAALAGVKSIIGMLSKFIKANDANSTGGDLKKKVKESAFAAGDKVAKAAKFGTQIAALASGVGALVVKEAIKKAISKKAAGAIGGTAPTDGGIGGEEGTPETPVGAAPIEDPTLRGGEVPSEDTVLPDEDTLLTDEELEDSGEELKNLRAEIMTDMNQFKQKAKLVFGGGSSSAVVGFSEAQQEFLRGEEGLTEDVERIDSISDQKQRDKEYKKLVNRLVKGYSKTDRNKAREEKIRVLRARKSKTEAAKIKQKRKDSGRTLKEAVLNLGDATIKGVGAFTEISGIFKDIKDKTEIVDSLKLSVQNLYQAVGAGTLLAKAKSGTGKLSTKEQASDNQKAEAKKQSEELINMRRNSEETLRQVQEISNALVEYRGRRGGGSSGTTT